MVGDNPEGRSGSQGIDARSGEAKGRQNNFSSFSSIELSQEAADQPSGYSFNFICLAFNFGPSDCLP